ncbi:type II toxin-antitoxin system RelE/ParE family toxin, partial [Treponema sp. R6D11]
KKIKEKPFIYPAVPDEYLASKGFRFTMVKNYILFYKVKEKQINIDRFLYGHRDWMNILGSVND